VKTLFVKKLYQNNLVLLNSSLKRSAGGMHGGTCDHFALQARGKLVCRASFSYKRGYQRVTPKKVNISDISLLFTAILILTLHNISHYLSQIIIKPQKGVFLSTANILWNILHHLAFISTNYISFLEIL
jgi:hypothetical protein